MPPDTQRNVNVGVGIGVVLQLAGLFLPDAVPLPALLSPCLILLGLPPIVWGAMHYAEGKGRSKWFGLLGAAGVFGLGSC